jgi:hypothetical protein
MSFIITKLPHLAGGTILENPTSNAKKMQDPWFPIKHFPRKLSNDCLIPMVEIPLIYPHFPWVFP